MWTVLYKKELGAFFYGYTAYFVFAAYLLLSMVCTCFDGLYFVTDNPSMRSYFACQPAVLAMVMPVIAMRLWAEEAKTGTEEILLTLPAGNFALVSAKIAAGWTVGTLMLLMSVPLAVSTMLTVATDPLNIASAYGGVWLTIMVLTVLGGVVSALTALPFAAYLISLVLSLLLMNINLSPLLRPLAEKLPDAPFGLSGALDFPARYMAFMDGHFGPADIFYFLSLGGVLLVLNWMVVSNKRNGI